jgi:hypothetical protein
VIRSRLWFAAPLLLAAAISITAAISVAADQSPSCDTLGLPSKFDFVVLASLADSQRPVSLAGYRRRCAVVYQAPKSPRLEVAVQLE